jgi:hypothetical protein
MRTEWLPAACAAALTNPALHATQTVFQKQLKDTHSKPFQACQAGCGKFLSVTPQPLGYDSGTPWKQRCQWQVINHRRVLWSARVLSQNPGFVPTKPLSA